MLTKIKVWDVKPEPKDSLEDWFRWKNDKDAEFTSIFGKRVKVYEPNDKCQGCGRYGCRVMGCYYDAEPDEL